MIHPLLIWLLGLFLLLAVAVVPFSLFVVGVWIAWHYGGWLAAMIVFLLLTPVANIVNKLLRVHWGTYKAMVKLRFGTDTQSKHPEK